MSTEALRGLVEEFVSREGTDYGHSEPGLESKVRDVMRQLESGRVVVLFDESSGTCNIVTRDELEKRGEGPADGGS